MVVIDSVTALINSTLPRAQEGKLGFDAKRGRHDHVTRQFRLCMLTYLFRAKPLGQKEASIAVHHEIAASSGLNEERRRCSSLTMCYEDAI